jgi:hypothetical protein
LLKIFPLKIIIFRSYDDGDPHTPNAIKPAAPKRGFLCGGSMTEIYRNLLAPPCLGKTLKRGDPRK